jgi:hypothetical protein
MPLVALDGKPPASTDTSTSDDHPRHHMLTRARAGVFKPNPRYAHRVSTAAISPIPKSARAALQDPNWFAAMQAEFDALRANETWALVPRPAGVNVVSGKWGFRHKLNPDGSLDRYKARWVVRGFSQRPGIDFGDTFSPVVKPSTIRTVLSIIASKNWPAHQLDVSNAFLHGHLQGQVFAQQPVGFVDPARPHHICSLSKSLYGLKQAPRAWFLRFTRHIKTLGFTATRSDSSLFVLRRGAETAFLLLYVDDMVLIASTDALLWAIIAQLQQEFKIKDMGPLHFFLGVDVQRSSSGFFLSQSQYAEDVLERAGMANCKLLPTPVDTKPKLSSSDGNLLSDPSYYRSIAGALQYLTITRPDITYAVQQICLHMHAPRDAHWSLAKRVLRYIRGTSDHGLHLHGSSNNDIVAYSDADWAGYLDTRRSTSCYCVFLENSLISWSSKRQTTVSRSSAEAEYHAVVNCVAECS